MLARLIRAFTAGAAARDGHYVCLMGGLGNQLFQYAYARFLVAQGVPVRALVTNLFAGDRYARTPLVQALSTLPAVRLAPAEIAALKVLADEDGFALRDALAQSAGACACRGYWQDHRYADAVGAELAAALAEFGDRTHPVAAAPECVLHVRRHDYGHHGLLALDYYRRALAAAGNPRFRVVTDEPNFCDYAFRDFAGFDGVVCGAVAEPWGDFFLMAAARVQVIANSSFSWWTAWLGRARGVTTQVLAPAEWSLVGGGDPCPPDWQRVDLPLLRP